MDKELFDIGDNEIRVLGPSEPKDEKKEPRSKRPWWLWLVAALVLASVVAVCYHLTHRPVAPVSTYQAETVVDTTKNVTVQAQEESVAYTTLSQETVNDVELRIYTPVGGHVELYVGQLPDNDKSIILAAQAADYRRDNGQISGAFVYKGELLSRGHPKYGFCAIIGNKLTMGMSRETSLFERAVEQEGYFFRQFSFVHDGKQGESLPKGKAIRRALCYYQEDIVVIESTDRESMHDFAQALLDLGVQESIALVGSVSLPLYVNEEGQRITNELSHREEVQETYIVWRK